MIDIHSHVIPFVDDGSPSIEASIEMLKHSSNIGITDIICTPHHIRTRYEASAEEIRKNFDLLNEAKIKENINVNLYLGQEIHYSHREDIFELIKEDKCLSMNNTNYILLEFSYNHEPTELEEIIYNLQTKGLKVIIAHVERYNWITIDTIKYLKSEGAYIQVNANAVIGLDGFKMKKLAKKLIKLNLVDCIASDMHSFRKNMLDVAYKKIKNDKLFNGIDGLI